MQQRRRMTQWVVRGEGELQVLFAMDLVSRRFSRRPRHPAAVSVCCLSLSGLVARWRSRGTLCLPFSVPRRAGSRRDGEQLQLASLLWITPLLLSPLISGWICGWDWGRGLYSQLDCCVWDFVNMLFMLDWIQVKQCISRSGGALLDGILCGDLCKNQWVLK